MNRGQNTGLQRPLLPKLKIKTKIGYETFILLLFNRVTILIKHKDENITSVLLEIRRYNHDMAFRA